MLSKLARLNGAFLSPLEFTSGGDEGPLPLRRTGEKKHARAERGEGSFSAGQLSGIHCARLPPPPLTRRNHSRLPAPLSPLPKQTERAARANGARTRTRENGPPCNLHFAVCHLGLLTQSKRLHALFQTRVFCVYLPSNPAARTLVLSPRSLPLPLAFIELMNSIVISTANAAVSAV